MKLFYSPFHDFIHKVLVVIQEAGVQDDVELVATFPFRNLNAEFVTGQYDISAINPLGKVPFLALENGKTIYPSQVVAEYIDSFAKQPLFPSDIEDRVDALRRLALGDAIFDFAVQMSMEGWREEHERRADLYDWLWPKIERSMQELERESANWSYFDIGHVGVLQGISYLDAWATGRDDIPANCCANWRQRWPELDAWFDLSIQRPSIQSHYRIPYAGDTSPEQCQAAVASVLEARKTT
jgi:glutathione S-transferase